MRGIPRVLAVGLLVAAQVLDGAGPAAAETFRWTAFQRSATVHFTDESVDAIADTPRPFTREWGRSVHKEPRGDPEWPARIRVTTSHDPATLTTYPPVTPTISSGSATYSWDTTTNGMQPFVTGAATTDLTPGFSLSRAIDGGREVPGGTTVRRTVTIRSVVSAAFESMQFGVTLGPQPGQPITPSAVSCVQPPSIYGSQYDWYLYRPAAGSELVIQCEVTLTNTTVLPARWSPHIFVNAYVSFVESAPVTGSAIGSSDDLGTTLFTVDVPGGDAQGTLRTLVQRLMSLRGENRWVTLPTRWTAQNSYSEFVDLSDDVAVDAVRAMSRSWSRSVHKPDGPAWPVAITVETALDPASLEAFPSATPVAVGATSRYEWSLQTGSFAQLRGRMPILASVGFDVIRSLIGGREIAAGATERRRFTVDVVATRALPSLNLFVYFARPGMSGPVQASDLGCSQPPSYPGEALIPQWVVSPVASGGGLHIACEVTLTNTSAGPASYMPGVSASHGTSFVETVATGAATATYVDPVLGPTTFRVAVPEGVAHEGLVTSFKTQQVYLRDENRAANTVEWYSTVSTDLVASDPGDAISSASRAFSRSFGLFAMLTAGASWPTTIEVTTRLPTTDLSPFPSVSPTIGPDGATYRWSGTQPLGMSASLRQLTPVVAEPTLAVSRSLDGGREIPAGATVTRQLTATVAVAAQSQFLVATVAFRPFVPPDVAAPPVIASDVSCPGATFYPFDLMTARWFALAGGAGQIHTLTCTVRLTNTGDRPARYMPEVSVQSSISSVHSSGTDRFAVDDPVLGRASVTVSPSPGVVAAGRFLHLESRRLVLTSENAAVPYLPWSFFVTAGLAAGTAEDSYADDDRAFARGWSFSVARPAGWGASISATTALDTTGWVASPAVAPTIGTAGTTYRWVTTEPFLSTSLSTLGAQTERTTLGASVTRELVGGAVVPPGTATRELVIRIVRSSSDPVRVSTYFHSSFDGPGGPVTASSVSCAGGTPQGTTGAFWLRLTPPIGVPLDLRCTAVLTNATPYDVSYMPLVIVARDAPPVVSGPHAGRTTYDVPVEHFGTVRAEVTPPAGVLAEGTLTTHASRVLTLGYRNARLIPTRLELAGDASRYVDERITVSARLTDAVTGAGLAGRWVDLRIGPLTRSAMTDGSGVASAELIAGALAVGVHSVTATFAGAGEHLASSSSSEVEILRIPTSIAYTGDASATFGFAGISARLTDRRSGAPIAGAPLEFTIDGFAAGPATTDATGTAVLTAVPLPRLQPGGHVIGVAFGGDAARAPAQTTAQVAITGSSGSVVGGVVAANGARVELAVASDGAVLSGQLRVATAGVYLHVRDIRALGIVATVAVVYARSDDGHDVITFVTDAGEPATHDRLILRLDGESLTGDGTIAQGNLQILR